MVGERPEPVILKQGTKSDRSLGSLSHILGPFVGFLAPLIIYIVKNDEASQNDPLLSSHLKEALNASITFLIASFIHGILTIVLIGCLTLLVHWILYIIWAFNANSALQAGQEYRYPFTFRFLD
ncbi:MAG: DUF4870 domain-containing protein [Candidatus Thalassarchaeaceae archaeon]|nr:MAG: hypothetical protein CND66_01330 [Marine Group II euryarchaeote MED-G37]|tara:strand:- start:43 stop:414 length:372 start_codon:yes stop_codon:yes gene_type:complete